MKTALITGATDGIGLEFAKIFAGHSCNLVLVARNEERLLQIKQELSASGITVDVFPKDLSVQENAEAIYLSLKERGIAVDFLINNAGFGIDAPYLDIAWEKEKMMLELNMVTVAYFTKMFGRDMKARGFGRILNVASIAAFQPGPYMAGYCATKAFILSLSEAVNYELKGSGVHVTALCPGVTDTQFHAVAKTEEVGMSRHLPHASAQEVAAYGYKLLSEGKAMGVYGWLNRLLVFSNRLVPRKVSTFLSARLLKGDS
ncbi:SDR family NAD(P)-dependent oxidoreductase [Parabacteroides pacaensis]|uniref:SDR family NAD(P)-dependent oxidoreductase n=1 Tax=Parabacteroides pacaensis TaxID=2086575 RepID=UPI000D0FFBE8|nr:SDR family oxidoreductase [Parabacteroides pacaensis]